MGVRKFLPTQKETQRGANAAQVFRSPIGGSRETDRPVRKSGHRPAIEAPEAAAAIA
jgi:hypothetical protein